MVGDDPERLDVEEVGPPPGGPAEEQLERAVGHFEVVTLVLEVLELVEHPPEDLPVELEAELAGLQAQRRATGHLRHHDAGAVADEFRIDMLIEIVPADHGARVQARLGGEDRRADVGLLGVRADVHQLGDVVRHGRQQRQAVDGDGPDRILSDRSGMAAERSAFPARSPYPLMQPCTCVAPA